MHQQIYVNLPVKDPARARAFFSAMGYGFNENFSNDQAICLVLGENLHAMLLQEAFFKTFTHKPLVDAHAAIEVLVCVSAESRAQVDDLVSKAVAAGGQVARAPQDLGFMYSQAFEDLDGHTWELVFMDPAAMAQAAGTA